MSRLLLFTSALSVLLFLVVIFSSCHERDSYKDLGSSPRGRSFSGSSLLSAYMFSALEVFLPFYQTKLLASVTRLARHFVSL